MGGGMKLFDFGRGSERFQGRKAKGSRRSGRSRTQELPPSLLFELLEPRVLLSATPLNTTALTSTLVPAVAMSTATTSSPSTNISGTAQTSSLDSAVYPSSNPTGTPPINGTLNTPGQADQYTFTLNSSALIYFDSLTN